MTEKIYCKCKACVGEYKDDKIVFNESAYFNENGCAEAVGLTNLYYCKNCYRKEIAKMRRRCLK